MHTPRETAGVAGCSPCAKRYIANSTRRRQCRRRTKRAEPGPAGESYTEERICNSESPSAVRQGLNDHSTDTLETACCWKETLRGATGKVKWSSPPSVQLDQTILPLCPFWPPEQLPLCFTSAQRKMVSLDERAVAPRSAFCRSMTQGHVLEEKCTICQWAPFEAPAWISFDGRHFEYATLPSSVVYLERRTLK